MSGTELLKFPCEIAVKAIGAGDDDMKTLVLDIVAQHVAASGIGTVKIRDSRSGRYQSVTVTVTADSRAQLDAIYEALSANKKVVMAL